MTSHSRSVFGQTPSLRAGLRRSGERSEPERRSPARSQPPPPDRSSLRHSRPPTAPQSRRQFLWTPMPPHLSQPPDSSHPLRVRLARHPLGPPRPVPQPSTASSHKPPQPLVGRLAADSNLAADLRHRLCLPEHGLHQLPALPNYRTVLPRHIPGKCPRSQSTCYPCVVPVP